MLNLIGEAGRPPAIPLNIIADYGGAAMHGVVGILLAHHTAAGVVGEQAGMALKLSDTPGSVRHLGPHLGQHTDEVLSALGYGQEDRERLRAQGIIG